MFGKKNKKDPSLTEMFNLQNNPITAAAHKLLDYNPSRFMRIITYAFPNSNTQVRLRLKNQIKKKIEYVNLNENPLETQPELVTEIEEEIKKQEIIIGDRKVKKGRFTMGLTTLKTSILNFRGSSENPITTQDKIKNLEKDKADAEAKVKNLEKDKTDAEAKVKNLEVDKATAEAKILKLEADIETEKKTNKDLQDQISQLTKQTTDNASIQSISVDSESNLQLKILMNVNVTIDFKGHVDAFVKVYTQKLRSYFVKYLDKIYVSQKTLDALNKQKKGKEKAVGAVKNMAENNLPNNFAPAVQILENAADVAEGTKEFFAAGKDLEAEKVIKYFTNLDLDNASKTEVLEKIGENIINLCPRLLNRLKPCLDRIDRQDIQSLGELLVNNLIETLKENPKGSDMISFELSCFEKPSKSFIGILTGRDSVTNTRAANREETIQGMIYRAPLQVGNDIYWNNNKKDGTNLKDGINTPINLDSFKYSVQIIEDKLHVPPGYSQAFTLESSQTQKSATSPLPTSRNNNSAMLTNTE